MAMKNDAAGHVGQAQTGPAASLAGLTQQIQTSLVDFGTKAKRLFTGTRDCCSFSRLVDQEYERLDGLIAADQPTEDEAARPPKGTRITTPGIADEPWVSFTPRDLFGLALSGGGIRSATFNLGLLQALERKKLLKDLHYVSTVSGGGYIGGFWTAWRQRQKPLTGPDDQCFPLLSPVGNLGQAARQRDIREPAPIRHLREFSRFLMPRLGFFHSETWAGIIAILGGLVPALLATISLLVLTQYVWFIVAVWVTICRPECSTSFVALATFALLAVCETVWRNSGKRGDTESSPGPYLWLSGGLGVVSAGLWWGWLNHAPFQQARQDWLLYASAIWQPLQARGFQADPVALNLGPLGLPLVWIALAVLVLLGRAFLARFASMKASGSRSNKLERAAARLIVAALIWTGIAFVWEVAQWLLNTNHGPFAAGSAGAGAGLFGALFVWLRDWLGKPARVTTGSNLLGQAVEWLKPLAPQLLANLAVLALVLGTVLLVQSFGLRPFPSWLPECALPAGLQAWLPPWLPRFALPSWLPVFALIVILLTLLFFNPARLGLHDFYRSRICRCFLGAARAQEDPHFNRSTEEQPGDELTLKQLHDDAGRQRPIHLVCATANNLAGDILGNLYRGGRSAVISPFGVSLGNYTAPQDSLRLSSALTAAGAAFNSQMGTLSINLGPAVSILMCAFNLRLGLWVPHPVNPRVRPWLPGLRFFQEMFGQTKCDPLRLELRDALEQAKYRVRDLAPEVRDELFNQPAVHLSDGGHFENLAIYELVRRHCRYIIASDCGADPTVAFDDLANVQRRVREDFGVEIDIDVTPLRPGPDHRSRQHAVVGTIHYNGYEGSDKGTLIYFKPTLTGDEPPDVLQYQARNPAFPHESTGDQFYDEPQWEAYRRLGQHAGNIVFRFTDSYSVRRYSLDARFFVENVFLDATRLWHPAPEHQREAFLALTQRCSELEKDIREKAPLHLRTEFFPEAQAVFPPAVPPLVPMPLTAQEHSDTLYYLMLVAQVMEDVWVGAQLDTYWSHPLNDGWMNYFHRWASTASFRRWWPVIRPIFSIGFRDFVRDRFDLAYADNPTAAHGAKLTLVDSTAQAGLVWDYWRQHSKNTVITRRHKMFQYQLTLDNIQPGPSLAPFPVGLLLYTLTDGNQTAEWLGEDMFVPPSLNGSGITARFLTSIIAELSGTTHHYNLRVVFNPEQTRADPASRLRLLQKINFYKSRGFEFEGPADTGGRQCLFRKA